MLRKKRLQLIITLLLLPKGILAASCPDMSKSAHIPPGWVLAIPSPSNPTNNNFFTKATYSYNANFFPNQVICSYSNNTIIGFYSLISTVLYLKPQGQEWINDKNSSIMTCQELIVTKCNF